MYRPKLSTGASLVALVAFALVLGLAAAPAADAQVFYLTGKNLVPPRNLGTWGACVARVDTPFEPGATLSISCTHNVTGPIAAWVGKGRGGENGPQVLTFGNPDADVLADEWLLTLQQQVDLLVGNYHLIIASGAWPMGEVRGQIRNLQLPVSLLSVRFPLEASQIQPSPATTAMGWCLGLYDPAFEGTGNAMIELVFLCSHDVANVTSAKIYEGAPGVVGTTELLDLGNGVSPIIYYDQWPPAENRHSDLVQAILVNRAYLLVKSDNYDDGELRGQIYGCLNQPTALCLNKDRFQVEVSWGDSFGNTGQGQAVPVNADSGLFWFFNPNNLEMLVKVLNGCPVNGHYWVFSAATTNVAYTLRVLDTGSGEEVTYENVLGEPAETQLDSFAFDTCP